MYTIRDGVALVFYLSACFLLACSVPAQVCPSTNPPKKVFTHKHTRCVRQSCFIRSCVFQRPCFIPCLAAWKCAWRIRDSIWSHWIPMKLYLIHFRTNSTYTFQQRILKRAPGYLLVFRGVRLNIWHYFVYTNRSVEMRLLVSSKMWKYENSDENLLNTVCNKYEHIILKFDQ